MDSQNRLIQILAIQDQDIFFHIRNH